MRRLQRDVSEPRSNGVNIDTSTEQVHRGGVANGVRTDTLSFERRSPGTGFGGVAFDQSVDPKAGQRLAPLIDENRRMDGVLTDELLESSHGPGPKRTTSVFTAFAMQRDGRHSEVEVGNGHVHCFARPGSRVVEEQQQSMVADALRMVAVGGL